MPVLKASRRPVRALGIAIFTPFVVAFVYTFGGWAALVGVLLAPSLASAVLILVGREFRERARGTTVAHRGWMLIAALVLGLAELVWGLWLVARLFRVFS